MLFRLGLLLCAITIVACESTVLAASAGQNGDEIVNITPRRPTTVRKRTVASLRTDVKVVLIPVSVSDPLNRPITTLTRDNFRLLEDGVEQKITSFSLEEGPISLGLLFDSSGSMKNRIADSVQALNEFFQTTIPGDEFFVVDFNDRPRLLGTFTSAADEIRRRLGDVQAGGWTALLDAVAMATHELKMAKNRRKALLILSDGNDNNSRFTASEIKNMVMESDVRVYAIGLRYRPRLLQQLAAESGGKVIMAHSMSDLPDAVQRLSAEIRSHYLLGYSSNNPNNDGKYRKVKVELVQPVGAKPLYVSWRHGYYAPWQ